MVTVSEKNLKKAVKWYRLAADQGYAAGQNSLGLANDNGDGVEKNLRKLSNGTD